MPCRQSCGAHIHHSGQPGSDSCIGGHSGEQVVAYPEIMLAVIKAQIGWAEGSRSQSAGRATPFLELPFSFTAQVNSGLGKRAR